MAKAFKPQIVTANDLLDGDAIFMTVGGWSGEIGRARIARTLEEAEAMLKEANAQPGQIVGAYLIDVDAEGVPLKYREALRTLGPSNRRDLGKQADRAYRAAA